MIVLKVTLPQRQRSVVSLYLIDISVTRVQKQMIRAFQRTTNSFGARETPRCNFQKVLAHVGGIKIRRPIRQFPEPC